MQNPVISIIIVDYKNVDILKICLRALLSHPIEAEWEGIVIENGSGEIADLADEFAGSRRFRFRFNEKNIGFAASINQGFHKSSGELLLVLNPDVVVHSNAVNYLARALRDDDRIGLVGPRLLNHDGTLQYSCRRFYDLKTLLAKRTPIGIFYPDLIRRHLMMDCDHRQTGDVDWIVGAAFMIKRDILKQVGGFDERYFLYFEDVDLCRSVWRSGHRVVYVSDAEMHHHHARLSQRVYGFNRYNLHHIVSYLKYRKKWQ